MKNSQKVYIHNLEALAAAAGVKKFIEEAAKKDEEFETGWSWVSLWNEEYRYDRYVDETMAKSMLDAVSNPEHGVLPCLKQYW